MIVIWIVKGIDHEQKPPSLVQYGNVSGNYTRVQAATNRTYDVGIGGWKGTIYEAWMTDLDQCQTYYYRYLVAFQCSYHFSQSFAVQSGPFKIVV